MMTEAKILEDVKKALGITGDFLNDTLSVYVREVIQFLSGAGVADTVIFSNASVGIISRGVCDLWNYGNAGGVLSPYFMQRATQLSYKAVK
jgi:hypothetical protein